MVKAQLQQYVTEKYHDALIRSGTERFLDSCRARRSISDERESALAKEVIEIQHKGIRYTEAAKIATAFHDHYSTLFAGSSRLAREHEFSFLLHLPPQLTDDQCALVFRPITFEEVKPAISDLKINKTLGHMV